MSPMDVDGDGTNEALAILQLSSKSDSENTNNNEDDKKTWEWKILDLKALSPRSGRLYNTAIPPFEPSVLLSYHDTSRTNDVTPIQVVTGQVQVKKDTEARKKARMDMSRIDQGTPITDRNRHFFCGDSWHHAAETCSHPCPGGQASECPDDQRCYADTPCNIEDSKQEDTEVLFKLTPGGGLPSVITLWSDGALSMTSITDVSDGATTKKDSSSSSLELKSMWKVQLLPQVIESHKIYWEGNNILFLDSYDSSGVVGADHGMIVVTGSVGIYGGNEEEEPIAIRFVVAVEPMTGKILWNNVDDTEKEKEELPLPVTRGTSSYARRRSRIPGIALSSKDKAIQDRHPHNTPDCQATFRRHLDEVLPYSYWTQKDSHLAVIHLSQSNHKQQHHHHHQQQQPGGKAKDKKSHPVIGKDVPKLPTQKKKWHHKFHKPKHTGPVKGRPNVLVVHNERGMDIRSLRNGYPICHMSLLEDTLYADLNDDGTIDQVQVLVPGKQIDHGDHWISALQSKLQKEKDSKRSPPTARKDLGGGGGGEEGGGRRRTAGQGNTLCHALALSGLPAREELFSTTLCGSAHDLLPSIPPTTVELDAISPIVVESLSGRRNTRDVIIALNNGMVHRLQGRSGRREWSVVGGHYEHFPIWQFGMGSIATMARVQSPLIPPPIRPIVLVGENSLAILSAKNGNIMAMEAFPQTSWSLPFLADFTGDGTTDIVVTTAEGIWGYQIHIHPGRPVVLRILVGLLLFSLMLAILRNRFGGGAKKDVRATDL